MQTKNCQNCKKDFIIESEDFSFYEKMQVPPPTFCPECRLKRRLMWRNERFLYKRSCDLCNSSILASYSVDSPYTIYCAKCWWGDKWDPKSFGLDYDFSKTFFQQFSDLLKSVPRIALTETNNIDSQYCNYSVGNNRLYYSFASHYNEDSGYLQYSNKLKSSYDCLHVGNSDRVIGCNYSDRLFNCAYVTYGFDCSDCFFGHDLHNSSNCIGCVNLRNASYQIFNKQYSKEEYQTIKRQIFSTNLTFKEAQETFAQFKKSFPVPASYQKKCTQSTGNDLEETKNVHDSFSVKKSEDSRYLYINAVNVKNCMDANNISPDPTEFIYECQAITSSSNLKFCDASWNGNSFCTYCNLCFGSSNLFGCIGMNKGAYSILNKQYTKEEYEDLVPKIIEHMNEMPFIGSDNIIYKYGEFFPSEISPFVYNESVMNQYFPLTKEQALKNGFKWVDREKVSYNPTFDNSTEYDIALMTDSLTDHVFKCEHEEDCNHQCPGAFKITRDEFRTYSQIGLPLPTLCPSCRHYGRLSDRGSYNLTESKCMCDGLSSKSNIYTNTTKHFHGEGPCGNLIKTTFTDNLHPIVYCEKCYQAEVV